MSVIMNIIKCKFSVQKTGSEVMLRSPGDSEWMKRNCCCHNWMLVEYFRRFNTSWTVHYHGGNLYGTMLHCHWRLAAVCPTFAGISHLCLMPTMWITINFYPSIQRPRTAFDITTSNHNLSFGIFINGLYFLLSVWITIKDQISPWFDPKDHIKALPPRPSPPPTLLLPPQLLLTFTTIEHQRQTVFSPHITLITT